MEFKQIVTNSHIILPKESLKLEGLDQPQDAPVGDKKAKQPQVAPETQENEPSNGNPPTNSNPANPEPQKSKEAVEEVPL
jgi:hypothetical protein